MRVEGKRENIVTNQSNYDGKILNHMWVAMTLHNLPSLPWKFIILVTHTSSITALWQKAINKRLTLCMRVERIKWIVSAGSFGRRLKTDERKPAGIEENEHIYTLECIGLLN